VLSLKKEKKKERGVKLGTSEPFKPLCRVRKKKSGHKDMTRIGMMHDVLNCGSNSRTAWGKK
jgi:hypothetical protein